MFSKAGKMFEHLAIALYTFTQPVVLVSINRGISGASTFSGAYSNICRWTASETHFHSPSLCAVYLQPGIFSASFCYSFLYCVLRALQVK